MQQRRTQIQQKTIKQPPVPVKQFCPQNELGIFPLGRLAERFSQNHHVAMANSKTFPFPSLQFSS